MEKTVRNDRKIPWGVLWSGSKEKLLHFLDEDENMFGLVKVRQKIYSRKILINNGEHLIIDCPSFVVKKVVQDEQVKIFFVTSKKSDPELFGYSHLQPGLIELDPKKDDFIVKFYNMKIVLFKNFTEVAPTVKEDIKFVKIIGKGRFGNVLKGFSMRQKRFIAVKVKYIGQNKAKNDKSERIFRSELEWMQTLKHPNIVRFFYNQSQLVPDTICMEFAPCGDMVNYLRTHFVCVGLSRVVFYQLLSAVRYLHYQNLLHRDIRPDNILIFQQSNRLKIKLADFGSLCKMVNNPTKLEDQSTVSFLPPEIIRTLLWFPFKNPWFKMSTDIFSLGVTMYYILHCYHPFKILYDSENFKDILLTCTWSQDHYTPPFALASARLKSLILPCLDVSEMNRPSIDDLLNHPFFNCCKRY